MLLSPGPGWGDGSHETTRLCLQAISHFAPRGHEGWKALDFGSGSGMLAISAAKLGGVVDAIEIDEAGLEHGRQNAELNGVSSNVRFDHTLDASAGEFDFVVANILRPVLLEFAGELTGRLADGGTLVLSGLVATDLPEVSVRYGALLKGRTPEIFRRGEWRALVWRQGVVS